MNLKLPGCFSNGFLFSPDGQVCFIIFALFAVSLLLSAYSLIVLSNGSLGTKSIGNYFFRKKRKGNVEVRNDIGGEVYQDALRILDQARSDSLKILGRAQTKAQGLLDSTYVISQENKKKLLDNVQNINEKQERALDNLSEELLNLYKSAIEEGKQENIRTLYEVTEAMKKEALSGVDEFKDLIKKETLGAKEALESKIMTEYAKVDEEIKIYREKRIKSLNSKIFDLLSDMYEEVIGEDFDQVKHEKLILRMLKEEINRSGLNKDF